MSRTAWLVGFGCDQCRLIEFGTSGSVSRRGLNQTGVGSKRFLTNCSGPLPRCCSWEEDFGSRVCVFILNAVTDCPSPIPAPKQLISQ
jgi:hypothetical protein